MQIELIDGGFIQIIENDTVKKIVCNYDGKCTVYFNDKPPNELNIGCTVFNRQYGIPVSEDGKKLFVGSWEKGIHAYDTASGSLLWTLPEKKIRNIFAYLNHLIALKANAAVIKVDIDSGTVLGQVKSGAIENAYDLGFPYALVDTVKGSLCILDVEDMKIVKNYGSKYGSKLVNPTKSLSIAIQDATLKGDTLTISGVEQENYSTTFSLSNNKPFSRVIDTDFYTF